MVTNTKKIVNGWENTGPAAPLSMPVPASFSDFFTTHAERDYTDTSSSRYRGGMRYRRTSSRKYGAGQGRPGAAGAEQEAGPARPLKKRAERRPPFWEKANALRVGFL